jgi:outer membrane lipoprotein-sorting protein
MRLFLCVLFITSALVCCRHAGAEEVGPEAILQRVDRQFGTLRDYECLVDTDCRAGSKQESRSFRLWYKQPGMLRARVLRGRSSGSEVVITSDGTIRGRKGGLLKPIVVRLSPDDGRIRNLRGIPISEFLWNVFYHRYSERAALPGARMILLPRQDSAAPYEISLTYSDQGRPMREVLRVDPAGWFLRELEIFDGSACVDRAVFHDWKMNPGLKDNWFRL